MTVGGIGGAETTCWSCMQPCSCCHRRDWSGRWTKRFSSGELIAFFYDCLKLCVNVGTTRQLWRKESRCLRLFLHMEERGNISDTCTCDDARAHTHREPKHTDTLSGTHMEISVQDSVENALPAHILRTQKCALHTRARTCTQARPSRTPRHSSGPTSTLAPGAGREARSERPTYRRCSTSRGSRLSPPSLAGQRTRTPV